MTEQQKLAQLIEEGYAKHNMKLTSNAFFSMGYACPIFAAYSTLFDSPFEADNVLTCIRQTYVRFMSNKIGINYNLCQAVSDLFDKNKTTDFNEVMEQLKNNKFPVDTN